MNRRLAPSARLPLAAMKPVTLMTTMTAMTATENRLHPVTLVTAMTATENHSTPVTAVTAMTAIQKRMASDDGNDGSKEIQCSRDSCDSMEEKIDADDSNDCSKEILLSNDSNDGSAKMFAASDRSDSMEEKMRTDDSNDGWEEKLCSHAGLPPRLHIGGVAVTLAAAAGGQTAAECTRCYVSSAAPAVYNRSSSRWPSWPSRPGSRPSASAQRPKPLRAPRRLACRPASWMTS